jgi:hypothetical protein
MSGAAFAALPFRFPTVSFQPVPFILAGGEVRFAASRFFGADGFCLPLNRGWLFRPIRRAAQISLWTALPAGRYVAPFLKEKLCRLFR